MSSDLFHIPGFSLFRNDRSSRIGGGIAVWAHSNLLPKLVDPDHTNKPPAIECLWLVLHSEIIMCACYIPPALSASTNTEIMDYLVSSSDSLKNSYPNAYVMFCGDFNNLNVASLMYHLDLINLVTTPTRNAAIIDLILIEEPLANKFSDSVSYAPVGNSDHNVIFVKGKDIQESHHYITYYDMRQSVIADFIQSCSNIDWLPLYLSDDDIDIKTKIFYELLQPSINFIPSYKVKITPNDKAWINPWLKILIQKRWDAYREKNFILYNYLKFRVSQEILHAKMTWANKAKQNKRGIWNLVDSIKKKSSSKPTSVEITAEALNQRFSDVFHTNDQTQPQHIIDLDVPWIPLLSILEVENMLLKCPKKSGGCDALSSVILRKASHILAEPIVHIFNTSLILKRVPKTWKIAKVIPVPKCTTPSVSDYRPVSLLPLISKLLERHILNHIYTRFEENFGNNQFGFRKYSNTACALIAIYDCITKGLDHKDFWAISVIGFDASKAFDTVKHTLLINKLINLGFPNQLIHWLTDYLTDRYQYVSFNNEFSMKKKVTSGVPQGAILSPSLYNIYTSDLQPISNNCKMFKYADDLFLVFLHTDNPDDEQLCSREILNVTKWSEDNGIKLNVNKSNRIIFQKSNSIYINYRCLNDIPLNSRIKILGTYIDSSYNSFNSHIQEVVKKVNRYSYILRILKPITKKSELILLYKSLIESVILYSSPLFIGSLSSGDNNLIIKVVKRCHYIICGPACNNNCLGNINNIRMNVAMKFFISILHNHTHLLYNIFPPFLPSGRRLRVPSFSCTKRGNSFIPYMCIEFNKRI